jgi:hypothetical protein
MSELADCSDTALIVLLQEQIISTNRSTMIPLAAASVVVMATLVLGAGPAMAESVAQEAAAEVAFVEEVKGQVVAYSHGTEMLLERFVIISDRTRLELRADSELRICHYGVNRLVTLSGPLQAVVSKDGVSAENGQIGKQAPAKCTPPSKSKNTGGLMMRGKPKPRPPE